MSKSIALSNSEKLEKQVEKDADFWLPLVKREIMTWLTSIASSQKNIQFFLSWFLHKWWEIFDLGGKIFWEILPGEIR